MSFIDTAFKETIAPGTDLSAEARMVGQDLWDEIRRLHGRERRSISALARRFDLDRKTVRRCLTEDCWRPYQRVARADGLLAIHTDYLRQRAPQVRYSARILYQELHMERGYQGSYDTVKRFVAPLRAVEAAADLTQCRFETAPGLQSQVDWGQAAVWFRDRRVVQHLFVLTLGFSRRSFFRGFPNERMAQFLEAHELAFDHFGGRTRELLYDRPRTVCHPGEEGRAVWNSTFKSFADYWGFEPRLCRAFRAQTKGKVESGVKYVKRNFLPGRNFVDQQDFDEQLATWSATVADTRIHGTTHERPLDRFAREREALVPTGSHAAFRLQARVARIVAEDYLVSFESNRYSVPFTLIGQSVEIERGGDRLVIYHGTKQVATHTVATGHHQMVILPEHGPGAIARQRRRQCSSSSGSLHRGTAAAEPEVEVRDLAIYEQLAGQHGAQVCI
jgi:transposase